MKKWYESKVVIFNIVAMVIMAAPIIATSAKALEPNAATLIDSIVALVVGIGNVVLRVWFTDTPIDVQKMRDTWELIPASDELGPVE